MALKKAPNPKITERLHGMRLNGNEIIKIAQGSPAEMCGLSVDDKVVAVNGLEVNKNLDKWLTYFNDDEKVLSIARKGKMLQKLLPQVDQEFMRKYTVVKLEETSRTQRAGFNKWSSKKG